MDPTSRGGRGAGGREPAAETGFIFLPGFLLPAASAGGRGRESLGPADHPGPVPDPARFPERACRRDWPFPVASLPGPEAPPTTRGRARTSPRAARRTRGPARRLLRGPRGGSEETGARWHSWPRLRGPDAVRVPRIGRDAGSCGGGVGWGRLEGAKMALGLARRQGWWRSCSAGAIFPGGAGGALRGCFSASALGGPGCGGSAPGPNAVLGPGAA
ncbi:translation initiation factor IF-2-like [Phacochoerus africanus]|uniref:translation initiation factor IF-2-like n=1 Tax=Phacochoerus africanus TaxID=41426 RepID=UPI001FDA6E1B|nr:translation initiation factor IF-2-like [Phacochoerus africanus]